VKNRFQNVPFKLNLHGYTAAAMDVVVDGAGDAGAGDAGAGDAGAGDAGDGDAGTGTDEGENAAATAARQAAVKTAALLDASRPQQVSSAAELRAEIEGDVAVGMRSLPGDVRFVTWTILGVISRTVFLLQNDVVRQSNRVSTAK
jgi:hypothetical protein